MTEHPTESLSAWLDGDLPAAEADQVAAHVAACGPCGAIVADLERIVGAARALEDQPPGADLWPGIEGRLGDPAVVPLVRRRSGRRFAFTLPQLAAAAIALIVLSAGATWLVRSGESPDGPGLTADAGAPVAAIAVDDREAADVGTALAELEQAFLAARDQLDPATVRTVETNLTIIDQAIDQTRQALAADPNSVYLHTHLAKTRQRKLDVLRNATALARTTI